MPDNKSHTYLIEVKGLVQGVGFRPFIYRLAHEWRLSGWVRNTNENVIVCLNTDEETLGKFVEDLKLKTPRASEIFSIKQEIIPDGSFKCNSADYE